MKTSKPAPEEKPNPAPLSKAEYTPKALSDSAPVPVIDLQVLKDTLHHAGLALKGLGTILNEFDIANEGLTKEARSQRWDAAHGAIGYALEAIGEEVHRAGQSLPRIDWSVLEAKGIVKDEYEMKRSPA